MRDNQTENKRNLLWLLGGVALFILTKGKTLLLALSKFAGPLISMAVSIWAYALLSPLWFAVGLVLLIFVHELGHVWAAKRKGLPVSAPLFIPFLGALIMMKRHPKDAQTEAYIAFGGPLVGTVGALVVYGAAFALNEPMLYAIANVGFLINLFNLVPIHPLDGGRISTAVSRYLWIVGLLGGAVLIVLLRSPLLFIIWALFAWDLYKKYVSKKSGPLYRVRGEYEVSLQALEVPWWYLSSDAQRQELPFTTYSRLNGHQVVQFELEALRFRGELALSEPGIIQRVRLTKHERIADEQGERLQLQVEVEYSKYVNDRYYEVPPAVRWKFGAAYFGLALFLIGMMWHMQASGLM